MIRVWAQFIGVLVIAFLAHGAVTGAFFNDEEGSTLNILAALKLDAEIDGSGFDNKLCGIGGTEEITFQFKNVGGLLFEYDTEIGNIGGDALFCAIIELTAFLNDTEVYSGPLLDFEAGTYPLEVGESDTWHLEATIPADAPPENVHGKTCSFDTVFYANQEDFLSGEAFYDVETLSHSIRNTGGGLGDVTIINENHATVTNEVHASSSTGGNSANGGAGGDGGDADGAEGNGGDGGDGGSGGSVTTGSASSSVTVTNIVNTNETVVSGCCECDGEGPCESGEEETVSHATSSPEYPSKPKREERRGKKRPQPPSANDDATEMATSTAAL